VEEFQAVVQRHGFWREDVKVMANIMQERLPLEGEPVDA